MGSGDEIRKKKQLIKQNLIVITKTQKTFSEKLITSFK